MKFSSKDRINNYCPLQNQFCGEYLRNVKRNREKFVIFLISKGKPNIAFLHAQFKMYSLKSFRHNRNRLDGGLLLYVYNGIIPKL